MVKQEYIKNLQGKEFVLYAGLLDLAHTLGLHEIETEVIQLPTEENNYFTVVKATARGEKGEFDGIGDASPKSVNKMIVPHILRMAETRAKARTLRDYTNVGITAFEELGGEDPEPTPMDQIKLIIEQSGYNPEIVKHNAGYLLAETKRPYAKGDSKYPWNLGELFNNPYSSKIIIDNLKNNPEFWREMRFE